MGWYLNASIIVSPRSPDRAKAIARIVFQAFPWAPRARAAVGLAARPRGRGSRGFQGWCLVRSPGPLSLIEISVVVDTLTRLLLWELSSKASIPLSASSGGMQAASPRPHWPHCAMSSFLVQNSKQPEMRNVSRCRPPARRLRVRLGGDVGIRAPLSGTTIQIPASAFAHRAGPLRRAAWVRTRRRARPGTLRDAFE